MKKPEAWSVVKKELLLEAQVSEDSRILQALEIISALEELLAAHRSSSVTGFVKADKALTRLEKAGYTR